MSKAVDESVERMHKLSRDARDCADHMTGIADQFRKEAVKLRDAVKADAASGLSDMLSGGED